MVSVRHSDAISCCSRTRSSLLKSSRDYHVFNLHNSEHAQETWIVKVLLCHGICKSSRTLLLMYGVFLDPRCWFVLAKAKVTWLYSAAALLFVAGFIMQTPGTRDKKMKLGGFNPRVVERDQQN